jgi:arsenate reductase (glutaredoxin)
MATPGIRQRWLDVGPDPQYHRRAMSADAPVTIYHNPVCGKSRGALEILRERGVDCEVVEYLHHPPDRATLEGILDLLGGPPAQLVRNDKRFRELGLRPEDYVTRAQVVALLLRHPELMERPVVIQGRRAVIARPSERVLELFE